MINDRKLSFCYVMAGSVKMQQSDIYVFPTPELGGMDPQQLCYILRQITHLNLSCTTFILHLI